MTTHDCGYPEAQHADFRLNGACVIDLPDEPKRFKVTAEITVEAASAQEAIEMFDQEYRDTLNVVHLRAEPEDGWRSEARPGRGERRNGSTVAYR